MTVILTYPGGLPALPFDCRLPLTAVLIIGLRIAFKIGLIIVLMICCLGVILLSSIERRFVEPFGLPLFSTFGSFFGSLFGSFFGSSECDSMLAFNLS